MKTEIDNWQKECEAFYEWFKALGGNIASDEQMSEAFKRIEAKSVSDNRLYKMLDNSEVLLKTDIKLSKEFKGFM